MNESKTYFSQNALQKFIAAEQKVVKKVVCHLWYNSSNPNEALELIDNVEIYFSGTHKLTISCNEEGTGLDAVDYNYELETAELKKEFGDKIKIFALDASSTKMWKEVIGKKLESTQQKKKLMQLHPNQWTIKD